MQRWIWLLALALLWAPSFLLIKIAIDDIPPVTLAAARLGMAAVLLIVIFKARGGRLPRDRRVWRDLSIMGLFGSAFPFAAISIGEQFAESGMAAIFNGATPIATAILAHLFVHDERMTPAKLVGVLIAFGGILVIFVPELSGAGGSPVGVSLFLAAALSYGIGIVHARRNLRGLAPLVGPIAQLGVGTLLLIPYVLLFESDRWQVPGDAALGSLLFLAVFGTALAYIVYYRILDLAGATFLSLVTYLLPPSGVLLGVIFLDERPGWHALGGCALIVVGVMLTNNVVGALRRRSRSNESAPAEPISEVID